MASMACLHDESKDMLCVIIGSREPRCKLQRRAMRPTHVSSEIESEGGRLFGRLTWCVNEGTAAVSARLSDCVFSLTIVSSLSSLDFALLRPCACRVAWRGVGGGRN